jgi:hypothetical protein
MISNQWYKWIHTILTDSLGCQQTFLATTCQTSHSCLRCTNFQCIKHDPIEIRYIDCHKNASCCRQSNDNPSFWCLSLWWAPTHLVVLISIQHGKECNQDRDTTIPSVWYHGWGCWYCEGWSRTFLRGTRCLWYRATGRLGCPDTTRADYWWDGKGGICTCRLLNERRNRSLSCGFSSASPCEAVATIRWAYCSSGRLIPRVWQSHKAAQERPKMRLLWGGHHWQLRRGEWQLSRI